MGFNSAFKGLKQCTLVFVPEEGGSNFGRALSALNLVVFLFPPTLLLRRHSKSKECFLPNPFFYSDMLSYLSIRLDIPRSI